MRLTQKVKMSNKRWWRIISVLLLTNVIQQIDKSMVSYAIPGGMSSDLGMNASVSGLLGSTFVLGYLFLQIPGGSLAVKGKSKKFLALTMVGWSLSLFLLGSADSITQALICRFLLGFCEGAIYPALVSIISNWFSNEERGRATAFFLASTSISQIILGPIAGVILIDHSWRILFHFAGVLSLLLVIVWLAFLTERPIDAKWLDKEEREYLLAKLDAENKDKHSGGKASLLEVLKDINVWKISFIYFTFTLGVIGFSFWSPTMIKTITKSGMTQTGFLSVIPYLMMFIGVILMGIISDKTQKRRLLSGVTPVVFTMLLVIAMVNKDEVWLSYFVICVSGLFLQGAAPNLWVMVPMLLPPEKAGSARGIINSVQSIGGAVGPFIIGYLMDITGNMILSWFLIFVFSIIGFFVSLTLPSFLNGSRRIQSSYK